MRAPRPVPRVSVLLPVRDGGPWLGEAVASILGQTLADLELLVIDDHSRDDALAGLPADPRLRLVANPGRGIVDALNAGIALARGETLARMDADDIAHPERLQQQWRLLRDRPAIGICATRVEIFSERGPPGGGYRRYQRWINAQCEPAEIAREMLVESPIPHPSAMFGADLVRALGGYRQGPWPEDYDLWLRAHAAGVAMAKPSALLLRWRDSAGRLSRRDARCAAAAFRARKADFLVAGPLARRAAVIWGAGPVGAALCDALVQRGAEVLGFIDIDPRKVGGFKRGRPVWAPDRLPRLERPLILGAVGAAGGRQRIRTLLAGSGRLEGSDFLMLA